MHDNDSLQVGWEPGPAELWGRLPLLLQGIKSFEVVSVFFNKVFRVARSSLPTITRYLKFLGHLSSITR